MCFAQYRHILINHLGYIAFMRNRLSQDTNIIPVIPRGNDVGPNIIKFLVGRIVGSTAHAYYMKVNRIACTRFVA